MREDLAEILNTVNAFAKEGFLSVKEIKEDLVSLVDRQVARLQDHPGPEDLEDSIANFTSEAYLSLLDPGFAGLQSKNTVYNPATFTDAAYKIASELENRAAVNSFYMQLAKSLKGSKRFLYKLVIRDVASVLEAAKKSDAYSRNAFSTFVNDILASAQEYIDSGAMGKGQAFATQFESKRKEHLPYAGSQTAQENGASDFTIDYLERLSKGSTAAAIAEIQKTHGLLVGANYHHETITFTFHKRTGKDVKSTDGCAQNVKFDLDDKVSEPMKGLLLGIGTMALSNASASKDYNTNVGRIKNYLTLVERLL